MCLFAWFCVLSLLLLLLIGLSFAVVCMVLFVVSVAAVVKCVFRLLVVCMVMFAVYVAAVVG